MAGHRGAAGHQLFVNTVGAHPSVLTEGGATICPNGKEVAERAEIVFVIVPDTPDVEKVLFGVGGVSKGLSKGKIVVDMSSISPVETKEFAKRVNALGCAYLDTPVSGGDVGAKAASLTIMVGGPRDVSRQSGRCSS
jgi:2-hydroxy-3-oxopropionate reductase